MGFVQEWQRLEAEGYYRAEEHKAVLACVHNLVCFSLKKRASFIKLARSGSVFRGADFMIQYLPYNLEQHKAPSGYNKEAKKASSVSFSSLVFCNYGITASRKVGNAVIRNLAKRRVRALLFPLIKQQAPTFSFSLNIVARPSLVNHSFQRIQQDMTLAFQAILTEHKKPSL